MRNKIDKRFIRIRCIPAICSDRQWPVITAAQLAGVKLLGVHREQAGQIGRQRARMAPVAASHPLRVETNDGIFTATLRSARPYSAKRRDEIIAVTRFKTARRGKD